MRSISDTIARLSAIRQHVEPFLPPGHILKELPNFGSNPGALRAKYYVPQKFVADAPLVVVLHGCLQTAEGYNYGSGWSQLADEAGFALLFPEQQHTNNPNLCFNWFHPEDTRAGSGEALSIRQMIDRMVLDHNLNRNKIFVTGLSAGGAMAGAMLATYPDVFAGGGIIAGLPYGTATTVQQAFDRMRGVGEASPEELGQFVKKATSHRGAWPRISIWHGDADRTVAPSNATAIGQQWRSVHLLDETPSQTDIVDGHVHRVWLGPDSRPAIEEYVIEGLGHGTPLATEAGYGAAGPFMLDAGISSTLRMAQFWGIAPADALMKKARAANDRSRASVQQPVKDRAQVKLPDAPLLPIYRSRPRQARIKNIDGIRKVIEDALRTAGLMK